MRDFKEMRRYWRNRRIISKLERQALLEDDYVRHLWGV